MGNSTLKRVAWVIWAVVILGLLLFTWGFYATNPADFPWNFSTLPRAVISVMGALGFLLGTYIFGRLSFEILKGNLFQKK